MKAIAGGKFRAAAPASDSRREKFIIITRYSDALSETGCFGRYQHRGTRYRGMLGEHFSKSQSSVRSPDHSTTGKPDPHSGAASIFQRDRHGNGTFELPMEPNWRRD